MLFMYALPNSRFWQVHGKCASRRCPLFVMVGRLHSCRCIPAEYGVNGSAQLCALAHRAVLLLVLLQAHVAAHRLFAMPAQLRCCPSTMVRRRPLPCSACAHLSLAAQRGRLPGWADETLPPVQLHRRQPVYCNHTATQTQRKPYNNTANRRWTGGQALKRWRRPRSWHPLKPFRACDTLLKSQAILTCVKCFLYRQFSSSNHERTAEPCAWPPGAPPVWICSPSGSEAVGG